MQRSKLTPAERQRLAVLRIEAKRREGFERSMRSNPAPTANVDTSANGPWYRNTRPVVGLGKRAANLLAD